jgi:hypothetical protein
LFAKPPAWNDGTLCLPAGDGNIFSRNFCTVILEGAHVHPADFTVDE